LAEFSTIKQSITILQLLDMMGIASLKPAKAKVKGEEVDVLRGECPCCKEGGDRAFVVYPHTNSYYCWSQKHGGDVLTLASRFWRIPLDEAGRKIAAHFNLSAPRKPAEAENGFDAEVFQRSLNPDAPELALIGISADTIRFYGGGYCTKPSLKGKLALPVRDIAGTIKFFMGIEIDNHEIVYPKLKGLVVPFFFGVDKLEGGTLHIVHHPIDLLRAVDNHIENVLALLTPVTADVLTSLKTLMDAKDLHTIEFH
jgi:hypothetical protein